MLKLDSYMFLIQVYDSFEWIQYPVTGDLNNKVTQIYRWSKFHDFPCIQDNNFVVVHYAWYSMCNTYKFTIYKLSLSCILQHYMLIKNEDLTSSWKNSTKTNMLLLSHASILSLLGNKVIELFFLLRNHIS